MAKVGRKEGLTSFRKDRLPDVYSLFINGYTSKEIAVFFGRSHRTIERDLRFIRENPNLFNKEC